MSNELEIFKVNQSELPNIITDQWRDIQGLEDKVKKSVKMAQTAKTSADRLMANQQVWDTKKKLLNLCRKLLLILQNHKYRSLRHNNFLLNIRRS